MYCCWGHSVSTSLGKVSKPIRQQKMTYKGGRAVKKVMSLTLVSQCTFLWSSISIPSSFLIKLRQCYINKKSIFKKKPIRVSEITIYTKNIIIPLLRQCGLFVNTCVSKNSIVSNDLIFCLFWYNAVH